MWDLLQVAVVIGAGALGYLAARRFVRGRLRFVDAVYSPAAPFLAAIGATAVHVFVIGSKISAVA